MKQFLKEKKEQLFDGELTLNKTDFWLLAAILFLLGVLYGLLKAPLTHGIRITCGNNNGNTTLADDDCDCCECAQCCECDDDEDEE